MSPDEELEKQSAPDLAVNFLPLTPVLGSSMTSVATGLIMQNDRSLFAGLNDGTQEDRSNRFSF